MKPPAVTLLPILLLCVCLAVVPSRKVRPAGQPSLPLLCAFDVAQHEPEFLATYHNDTKHGVDILMMYTHSTITLDGKIYPYAPSVLLFRGNPMVKPDERWSYTANLSDYVPGWTQRNDAEMHQGMRWHSLLPTGPHTVTLNMGGRQYGPAAFFWDRDRPFIIR